MTKNNKQDSTTLMQQAIATLLAAQANLANVHVTLISSQARSDERFARLEERLAERFERIDQRFNDIESRLAEIESMVLNIPERVRDQIGFKPVKEES